MNELLQLVDTDTLKLIYGQAVENLKEMLNQSKNIRAEAIYKIAVNNEVNKLIISTVLSGYKMSLAKNKVYEQVIEKFKEEIAQHLIMYNQQMESKYIYKYNIALNISNNISVFEI